MTNEEQELLNQLIQAEMLEFDTPVRPLEHMTLEELFGSALDTQRAINGIGPKEARTEVLPKSTQRYHNNVIPFPTPQKSPKKPQRVNLAMCAYSEVIPLCSYISETPLR